MARRERERWSWQDQLSLPGRVPAASASHPGVFPVRQIERNGRGFLANRWLRIWAHVEPPAVEVRPPPASTWRVGADPVHLRRRAPPSRPPPRPRLVRLATTRHGRSSKATATATGRKARRSPTPPGARLTRHARHRRRRQHHRAARPARSRADPGRRPAPPGSCRTGASTGSRPEAHRTRLRRRRTRSDPDLAVPRTPASPAAASPSSPATHGTPSAVSIPGSSAGAAKTSRSGGRSRRSSARACD
jgi:hypothetical protein